MDFELVYPIVISLKLNIMFRLAIPDTSEVVKDLPKRKILAYAKDVFHLRGICCKNVTSVSYC